MDKKFSDLKIDLNAIIPSRSSYVLGAEEVINKNQRNIETITKSFQEDKKKKEKFNEDLLGTVREIKNDTANLSEIVFLIREGNIVNEEIFNLFAEMLTIIKAKNKEEAENTFKNALQKALLFNNSVQLIKNLTSFGMFLIKLAFPNQSPI
jgi:hypothetical protein